MKNKDNPKAFPRPIGEIKEVGADKWSDSQSGLDLRDYFAAKAMTVLLQGYTRPEHFFDITAEKAYMMADAMLKERNKQQL